ncbi:MAG TPA: DUF2178 domain-containing protein [Planctomycetota bacterium]|nr:DUF2178 domain-containing protein [Planctomycetota bacterium]
MSREQKMAWLTVGCFAVGLIGFLSLLPFTRPRAAVAAFAVVGFGGLGPLLFRKKRDPKEVAEDERDKMIAQKATLAAGVSSYTAFVLVCMITWGICHHQGREQISIHGLPLIVFFAGLIVFFVGRAATILGLYGREAADGED